MKLIEFSVANFRSITKANKLNLGNMTVIVGRNNEGKSNLIQALNIAMQYMTTHASRQTTRRPYNNSLYEW